MFMARLSSVLATSKWQARAETAEFIEAWQYEGAVSCDNGNFVHGCLNNDQILDWVVDEKLPQPQQLLHNGERLLGRIRLLVCERRYYITLDFTVMQSTFKTIAETFHLHPATLPSFESEGGVYSRYLSFREQDPNQLERIAVVLKMPQKREISNWGLSFSHEVHTRTTTAILYGSFPGPISHDENPVDEQALTKDLLMTALRDSPRAWSHPMLLPCVLLDLHMARTAEFCSSLKETPVGETVSIERALGVVKVGPVVHWRPQSSQRYHHIQANLGAHRHRPHKMLPDDLDNRKLTRKESELLTVRINTHTTRIIFTARSPQWNDACSKFVLQMLKEINTDLSDASYMLKDLLEQNINLGETIDDQVGRLQDRMALQLNVLYSIVAQIDNRLTAELAVSAGRDSTSMKILAFISALFLPGSFVADIFSTGFFDWTTTAAGRSRVLTEQFWLYWTVAIPLTVVVIIGFAGWWSFERTRFDAKVGEARGDEGPQMQTVDEKKGEIDSHGLMYGASERQV